MRAFLADDTAARSVGAESVANRLEAHSEVRLERPGSRGLFWLEPLVELDTDDGRLGFANVAPDDVDAILAEGRAHPSCIGEVDALPFLRRQQRRLFTRVGHAPPLDLDAYRRLGGLEALEKARSLPPLEVIDAIERSGLRGRGGAGFPAGRKWRTVADQPARPRYLVCNADEGDSGTYADRLLMESDPFALLEGMLIAAHAVGAEAGFIYVRSEYPLAIRRLRAAIERLEEEGIGQGCRFVLRRGAGAYICGEETALLDSLEGRRGMVRSKPPVPAVAGLFGQPTLVHNVLTFAAALDIIGNGPEAYAALGSGDSRGTQPFQLAGNIACGGLVELEFGVTLRTLVEDFGGGTRSRRPIGGVQVGGPLGGYFGADELDLPATYEALASAGGMLGHGGVVVYDDSVDWRAQAEFAFEFCALESCGKCTPCRIGAVRGRELIQEIRAHGMSASRRELLGDLCEVMRDGSLCAMGGLTPQPVQSAMRLAERGGQP